MWISNPEKPNQIAITRSRLTSVSAPQVVSSTTGPGPTLTDALWHSADSLPDARTLWRDATLTGWEYRTAYRWHLTWRPERGLIR